VLLLRRYATKVEAVRQAESNYHDVTLTESLRHGGMMKRASSRRIDAAFDKLVDAVVDMQGGQAKVLLRAEDEGLSPEAIGVLDEAFASAERQYAGYLAARTYHQVREAATTGVLPGRGS
jgi:hypothetical protein